MPLFVLFTSTYFVLVSHNLGIFIKQSVGVFQTTSFLQTPVEKRDYTISELVHTEKNYIDVLAMIKAKFMRPLANVLKEEEKKCIFYGIEV